MTKKAKSKVGKFVALLMGIAIVLTATFGGASSALAAVRTEGENYSPDYDSLEDAVEAGRELSNEAALEGTVLLKNNGVLPMGGNEYVTVFGSGSDYADGIANGGFKVNHIESTSVSSFTTAQKNKMRAYNDAAIILLSSTYSGEGRTSGYRTDEEEDNAWVDGTPYTYKDGETVFTHRSNPYLKDGSGNKVTEYKNSRQVSDQIEELILYANDNFKYVIVMITSETTMEVGNLEASDKVDAILSVGDLGSAGWQGVQYAGYDYLYKLLDGSVNPSGRTYDLWAWDMTAQPTWANDGNGADSLSTLAEEAAYEYGGSYVAMAYRDEEGNIVQRYDHAGSNVQSVYYSVKYEEGIYSGYRYHETAAAEAALNGYEGYVYEQQVVYPFGYGLSYTTFEKKIVSISGAWTDEEVGTLTRDSVITVTVEVKNTGSVAGKDVVQLYGHAPYYYGGIEKSEVVLVGFEKTSTLKPGQTQTISIDIEVADLASFDDADANGNGAMTWELDRVAAADSDGNPMHDSVGHYEIRLQSNSHDVDDKVQLADLTHDVTLEYSTDEENVLSQDNVYNTLGYDPVTSNTLVEEGKMEIMSRSDFAGTFPEVEEVGDAETIANLTRSDEWFELQETYGTAEADAWEAYETALNITQSGVEREDDSDLPWAVSDEHLQLLFATTGVWKQGFTDDEHDLYFNDLIGVEYNSIVFQNTDPAQDGYTDNEKLVGLTGIEAWNILLNKMTIDEMKEYVSNGAYTTAEIESIEKSATRMMDSASIVDQELGADGLSWGGSPHYAATWNKDLMYRRGLISGNIALLSQAQNGAGNYSEAGEMNTWYAPGMDLHRSAFGGRNSEYFSEDPFLSGTTAGLFIQGMRDKGIMCTAKHFALNECEQEREMYQTYASEQACRELYMKQFEIVVEDYDVDGMMLSYNCIGDFRSDTNYAVIQQMVRDQWGFDGFLITDAVNPTTHMYTMDTFLRAGANLLLSSFDNDETNTTTGFISISGDYNESTGRYELSDGTVSNTQWSVLRTAVRQLLYAEVNSSVAKNGIDVFSFTDAELPAATQGAEYSADIGIEADTSTYTVTSGALPEGLTISDSGIISGVPLEAGEFTFTVEFCGDGWVKESATFKIVVNSGFTLDDGGISPETGTEYSAYIESDYIRIGDGYYDSLTYDDNGTLPEGLTIDELGEITGTPVNPGTYEVTITVTATRAVQSGWSTTTQTYQFDYVFTLTVGGEAPEVVTIDSIKADLDALAEQLESGDLTGINSQLESIQSQLATLEDVASSADIDEIDSTINSLQDKISELESNSGSGNGGLIAVAVIVSIVGVAVVGCTVVGIVRKKKE